MPHATIKNVLLTGPPGCGKTTVIRQVVGRLVDLRLAGFYTQEIRQQGQRVGFEAIGLDGQATTLAHVDSRSSHRIGRYGVDVGGFEAILQAELARPADSVDIFVIDEIGKMECPSRVFVEAVTRMLDSPVPVLATVAAKGRTFIAAVRGRPDVEVIAVSTSNRDRLAEVLTSPASQNLFRQWLLSPRRDDAFLARLPRRTSKLPQVPLPRQPTGCSFRSDQYLSAMKTS